MGWCKYGGKRKSKPVYNSITFDSEEEVEFYMWCEEALLYNVIDEFQFHNEVFKLIDKSVVKCSKSIRKQGFLTLQDVEYELDFKIKPCDKLYEITDKLIRSYNGFIYIDTKGDYKGNDVVFSIKQKLMWKSYNLYVNRVVPLKFFKQTWRPKEAGLTKVKREVQSKYKSTKTYEELQNGL